MQIFSRPMPETCETSEEPAHFGKWQGWRKFFIQSRRKESEDITTLSFSPVDGKPVPLAKAGQFICVEVELPSIGQRRRNYSISSAPSESHFQISVKDVKNGLVSPYLAEKAAEGDIFNISGPYGEFCLQPDKRPIALISGGCGVGPMMSLIEEMVRQKYAHKIHYIHSTQTSATEAFHSEIAAFAAKGYLKADIFYSRSEILPENSENVTLHKGRLSSAFLMGTITPDMDCYICGPQGIMFESLHTLGKIGVPRSQVFYELNACI